MAKNNLNDRVVIITGASSGIGEALACRMAGEGCRLGLIARRKELLDKIADKINRNGGRALSLPADVVNFDQLKESMNTVLKEFGQIDIAVANAGVAPFARIATLKSAALRQIMDINFFGAWNLFECVLPNMLERGSGHLVGVSTFASFRGMQRLGPYSASKSAINILLESARVELYRKNIHCTIIMPAYVKTPLTDTNKSRMPFMISADKAASVIAKSIRNKRKQVIFPWQFRVFAPIFRNVPNWLFDLVLR